MRRILWALSALVLALPGAAGATAPVSEARWDAVLPRSPGSTSDAALFPDGTGYLTTSGPYLLRTTDHGATWHPRAAPLLATSIGDIDFTSPDVGYAEVGWGIFRTADGGTTWTETGMPAAPRESNGRAVYDGVAAAGDNVFVTGWAMRTEACEEPPRLGHYVWRSADGGRTWRRTSVGMPGVARQIETRGGRRVLLLLHSFETYSRGCSHTMVTNRSHVLLSENGGKTFVEVHRASFVDEDAVEAIAMPARNRFVLGTRAGRILLSNNGGRSFRVVARPDDPSSPRPIDGIGFGTRNVGYAGTTGTAIWRTTDGGRRWTLEPLSVPVGSPGPPPETGARGAIGAAGSERAIAAGPGIVWRRTSE